MGLFLFYALMLTLLIAALFPETELGRGLHNRLVAPVASHLNRLRWAQLAFFAVLIIGFMALSYSFPPGLAFIAAGDMAAYAELVAAVMALKATLHIGRFVTAVRVFIAKTAHIFRLPGKPPGQGRNTRVRTPASPSSAVDEDEPAAWVIA